MWILTPLEPGGVTHYLLPNKEYVVGRKNCDILLASDQSISRAHAHLRAGDEFLTLKDSSKYGTFVNEEQLSGDTPRSLQSGDRVTFGVFHSKFSVEQQGVVVCSSCLDNTGKATLSQALLLLGGRLVNTWTQDCTHLVMPSVKVTIKTICALMCCRPIVKQEYFVELSKALTQKQPPPKVESFCPDIDEPSLKKDKPDLRERPERKRLFSGKTFLFLSDKQLKRLSSAVTFGGGRSQLLEEGSLPTPLLESPGSCVVDAEAGNSQVLLPATKKWADSVGRILQTKGLRFIAESEIGLAAMYVTCGKYCNPSHQMGDSQSMRVKPAMASATLSQNVAVDETVLPAASQNITAYVVNTETSQRMGQSEVTAVGETPERRRGGGRPAPPPPASARERPTACTAAETAKPLFRATESAGGAERKRAESALRGGGKGEGPTTKFSAPRPPKRSPLKQQSSQQSSPHKQACLTSFFQPVDKKRPREEESSAVESEPKRTAPLHSDTTTRAQTVSNVHASTARAKSSSLGATTSQPAPRAQSEPGSGADLFPGHSEVLSDRVSRPAQQGPRTGKRKEVEEDEPKVIGALGIGMEELESIMSEEMEELQEDKPKGTGALDIGMEELESIMSEEMEEPETRKRKEREEEEPKVIGALDIGMEELESIMSEEMDDPDDKQMTAIQDPRTPRMEQGLTNKKQPPETWKHAPANKKQCVQPVKQSSANQKSSLDPEEGSSTSRNQQSVKDNEASKPRNGVASLPEAELETNPKHATVKQEFPVSEADEDLPRRLVLVEFKSLTVMAPSGTKPRRPETNSRSQGNNFKRFHKVAVPGAEGLPNIIGGSDLLAYNRGRTSELEEWLRDAAEEERQSKREESVGDDLFRYNPKPGRRR